MFLQRKYSLLYSLGGCSWIWNCIQWCSGLTPGFAQGSPWNLLWHENQLIYLLTWFLFLGPQPLVLGGYFCFWGTHVRCQGLTHGWPHARQMLYSLCCLSGLKCTWVWLRVLTPVLLWLLKHFCIKWPITCNSYLYTCFPLMFLQKGMEAEKKAISLLSKLRNELQTDKPIIPLVEKFVDTDIWNQYLEYQENLLTESDEKPRWFYSPWLFVECYMYRRIHEAIIQRWVCGHPAMCFKYLVFFGGKRKMIIDTEQAWREVVQGFKSSLDSCTTCSPEHHQVQIWRPSLCIELLPRECLGKSPSKIKNIKKPVEVWINSADTVLLLRVSGSGSNIDSWPF